ncbi:SIS domain protein [Janibacter sp. HTCC2649]|uniref:SIS domain-containing protein n=1 Tax=Janibacter sp. HTCC2649 TaxID=313589 RepID=UPI0000670935|nr:SIS domain-containing protein [Janibacter sp. HTCC2649]EAQ00691.1 SIS domain protein [Janibacter sp. HTCC2649]
MTITTHSTPALEPTAPGSLMRTEISEQASIVESLLGARRAVDAITAEVRQHDIRYVLLAARGSSDHAALYAKYLVETVLGLSCGLASMSTVTGYGARSDLRGVLWVAISQSGGSPDLVAATAAAGEAGALTLAVTNAPASDLAGVAQLHLDIAAGVERSVAATKTYTAELLALWLLVDSWVGRDGRLAAGLPEAVASAAVVDVSHIVNRYRYAARIVTTGRGFSYPTAREAALKLMETCHVAATAFSGADLLHGPVAHVDGMTPVIVVSPGGVGGRLLRPVLDVLDRHGAEACVVGDALLGAQSALRIPVPPVVEELTPIVQIVPLQRLALGLALSRGLDPDRPRGLSKVTSTL